MPSTLNIGYLWHYEEVDISRKQSASVLHINAIAGGLQQQGHRVRTLAYVEGKPHYSETRQQWHEVPFVRTEHALFRLCEKAIRGSQSRLKLPYWRFFDSCRFADAAIESLSEMDILYERYWLMGYGGLMAAKRLGIPLILEINGDIIEEYAQLGIQLSKAQWQVIYFLTRRIFERADHLITVSEPLRERTIERWQLDPDKVSAVANGAHLELFASPNGASASNTNVTSPTIIFVGSFKPWHGVDQLVEAFATIARSHPKAHLCLVGDGPVRSEMEHIVSAKGIQAQVSFTGKVAHKEVAHYLQQADIAVLTPAHTGASVSQSPLKLFEYMAAGKAIIAPDLPNLRPYLSDRHNALLFSPDEPEAFANTLSDLLTTPMLRQHLGQNAQQQALEKHSWQRTVSEIESIMYRLLG